MPSRKHARSCLAAAAALAWAVCSTSAWATTLDDIGDQLARLDFGSDRHRIFEVEDDRLDVRSERRSLAA